MGSLFSVNKSDRHLALHVVLDQHCYSTTQTGHSQMTSWFRETQQKPDLIASRASESVGEKVNLSEKLVYKKKKIG